MFRQEKSQNTMREALSAIFPRLWRYCLVVTGNRDHANDLAQAVCVRALEKHDQFKIGTYFDRWLFRIAQRMWINEIRKQKVRQGQGLIPAEEADLIDPRSTPEMNLFARQVLLEVMALPEAQRVAVSLVYIDGFSYKEAAEVLEIPIGTIMSRLSAARAKLSGKFAGEEETS